MKCTHVCGPKSLLTLYQIINKPEFPSITNEIAEPRPDMNIKVAAFTVSEKSINIVVVFLAQQSYPLINISQLILAIRQWLIEFVPAT